MLLVLKQNTEYKPFSISLLNISFRKEISFEHNFFCFWLVVYREGSGVIINLILDTALNICFRRGFANTKILKYYF